MVSEEQQEYLRVVAGVLLNPPPLDAGLAHPVFASLASDAGLEQLVPYLVPLLVQETKASLRSVPKLRLLLHAMRALVLNPANNLEPYLHELLPCVMTCLVSKKLGTGRTLSMPVLDAVLCFWHQFCVAISNSVSSSVSNSVTAVWL